MNSVEIVYATNVIILCRENQKEIFVVLFVSQKSACLLTTKLRLEATLTQQEIMDLSLQNNERKLMNNLKISKGKVQSYNQFNKSRHHEPF